jgi:hypothetical protein
LVESNANLQEITQSLGWVADTKQLNYIENEGGPEGSPGIPYQISSTVGQGQGRRIVSGSHGFSEGTALRLAVNSGLVTWERAQATVDGSKNATHIVTSVIDASTFEVSSLGAWSLSSIMNAGIYYLSDAAGSLTTSAPANLAKQVVGICDGTSLYLMIGGGAGSAYDRMQWRGAYDTMSTYVKNDVVTVGSDLYIAVMQAGAGATPGQSAAWVLIASKTIVPASAAVVSSDALGNLVEGMIVDENNAAYSVISIGTGVKAIKIAVRVGFDPPLSIFESMTDVVTSGRFDMNLKIQSARTFFAGPSTGSSDIPAFRGIVPTDLGTGTPDTSNWLRGDGTWVSMTAASVGGLALIATSGSASDLVIGTVPAARMPALTGDVTSTVGTISTSIASTVVTGKLLTGYVAGSNSAIAATDSILSAFQKLQGQVNSRQDNSVSQTANYVFAAPSASNGVPSFRLLVPADIPNHDTSKLSSGIVATARLGSGTASASTFLRGDGTWAAMSAAAVGGLAAIATSGSASDLTTGTVPVARLGSSGVANSSTFLHGDNSWAILNSSDIPSLDWSKITTGKPTTLAGYGITSADTLFDSKYIKVSSYNVANGTPQLDSSGLIPTTLLPASILGKVEYKGTWNASTNTPTIPSAATSKGWYYIATVAGTYNSVQFNINDWIISDGTNWDKVDNNNLVSSVFGRVGAVVANSSDYSSFYPLLSGSYSNPSWITALDGSKITTGTVAAARLGSGSPSSINFLRGDGAWTAITAAAVGGLAAIATSGSASDLVAGTVPIARIGSSGTPSATTFHRGDNSWSTLTASDIPSLDWSKITTGKPTTLAGYGISSTDNLFDAKYVTIASVQTITGVKTFSSQTTFNGVITANSGIQCVSGGITTLGLSATGAITLANSNMNGLYGAGSGNVSINGSAAIGSWGGSHTMAFFGNIGQVGTSTAGQYALIAHSDGSTFVNAAVNKNIDFRNANSNIMSVKSDRIKPYYSITYTTPSVINTQYDALGMYWMKNDESAYCAALYNTASDPTSLVVTDGTNTPTGKLRFGASYGSWSGSENYISASYVTGQAGLAVSMNINAASSLHITAPSFYTDSPQVVVTATGWQVKSLDLNTYLSLTEGSGVNISHITDTGTGGGLSIDGTGISLASSAGSYMKSSSDGTSQMFSTDGSYTGTLTLNASGLQYLGKVGSTNRCSVTVTNTGSFQIRGQTTNVLLNVNTIDNTYISGTTARFWNCDTQIMTGWLMSKGKGLYVGSRTSYKISQPASTQVSCSIPYYFDQLSLTVNLPGSSDDFVPQVGDTYIFHTWGTTINITMDDATMLGGSILGIRWRDAGGSGTSVFSGGTTTISLSGSYAVCTLLYLGTSTTQAYWYVTVLR